MDHYHTAGLDTTEPALNDKVMSEDISDLQAKTLKKIMKLCGTRRRKREGRSVLRSDQPVVQVGWQRPNWTNPKFICAHIGDPSITVQTTDFSASLSIQDEDTEAASLMVSDLMVLAGEVAASWCKQRGIPILYRGSHLNPARPLPSVYKEKQLDPAMANSNQLSYLAISKYFSLFGTGIVSAAPIRHAVMGTDAYCRATSPLRRYGDMVIHWQIESALRHEAESGKSLIGTTDDPCLAFSLAQIEEICPNIRSKESYIRSASRGSNMHWILQLLARGFYFNEIELPKTWRVFVTAIPEFGGCGGLMQGIIRELSIGCLIKSNEASAKDGGVEIGDWWEARIGRIDLTRRIVDMEPIRLIEKTEAGTTGSSPVRGLEVDR
jgi:hypothetical protein